VLAHVLFGRAKKESANDKREQEHNSRGLGERLPHFDGDSFAGDMPLIRHHHDEAREAYSHQPDSTGPQARREVLEVAQFLDTLAEAAALRSSTPNENEASSLVKAAQSAMRENRPSLIPPLSLPNHRGDELESSRQPASPGFTSSPPTNRGEFMERRDTNAHNVGLQGFALLDAGHNRNAEAVEESKVRAVMLHLLDQFSHHMFQPTSLLSSAPQPPLAVPLLPPLSASSHFPLVSSSLLPSLSSNPSPSHGPSRHTHFTSRPRSESSSRASSYQIYPSPPTLPSIASLFGPITSASCLNPKLPPLASTVAHNPTGTVFSTRPNLYPGSPQDRGQ